jgi:hypothetical protein
VTRTLPEVGAGGVVRSLFCQGESGPHPAARESSEKSCEAIESRAYLKLGALEAQAHMSQVVAGGLEDESILLEGGEDEDVIDLSLSSPYIWRKLHADSEDDNE